MNKFLCATGIVTSTERDSVADYKILAFDIKCQLALNINNNKVPSALSHMHSSYLACISASAFSSLPTIKGV